MRLGLAAAGIAVAAACVTGGATTAAAELRGEGRSRPRYRRLSRHRHAQTVRRVERRDGAGTGVQARIVSPTFRESLADFIGLIARQHYDAVLLFGLHDDPQIVPAVARRYPKVPFVLIDASRADMPKAPPNVAGEVLQTREAAFLAGWLAAKLEQRRPGPDVVGAVGGFKVPGVTTFLDGFAAGARHAAPGVEVPCPLLRRLRRPYEVRGPRAPSDRTRSRRRLQRRRRLRARDHASRLRRGRLGDRRRQRPVVPRPVRPDQRPQELRSRLRRRVQPGQGRRLRPGRDTTLTVRDGAAGLGHISPRVPHDLVTQLRHLQRQIVTGKIRVSAPRSSNGG